MFAPFSSLGVNFTNTPYESRIIEIHTLRFSRNLLTALQLIIIKILLVGLFAIDI
jgi:hypothetical protein